MMKVPGNNENQHPYVLTGIQPSYTLSGQKETDDIDKVMIQNFIHTLAEITLTVASRNKNGNVR